MEDSTIVQCQQMKDYVNIVTIFQGWHVSSMDGNNHGKNRVISVTEEILSSLPFWEEMEETKKWYKIIIQI